MKWGNWIPELITAIVGVIYVSTMIYLLFSGVFSDEVWYVGP